MTPPKYVKNQLFLNFNTKWSLSENRFIQGWKETREYVRAINDSTFQRDMILNGKAYKKSLTFAK